MSAADGVTKEDKHSLRGVLFLRLVADDKTLWDQMVRVHWIY
jgi:hypothetical protein